MWFRSLLDSLKPRIARAIARKARRDSRHRSQATARLQFEPLEDRSLLSNYIFTDLATLGGSTSYANDINASGQVVGVGTTAGGDEHALLWNNGTMTDLGTLGGLASNAVAINDVGQVVGWAHTAAGYRRAFLVTPEDTDGNGAPDLWHRDNDSDGVNDLMHDLGTF